MQFYRLVISRSATTCGWPMRTYVVLGADNSEQFLFERAAEWLSCVPVQCGSLSPSLRLSRTLSRWDDKTETSWPGPIRDALQPRILFTGARCPNKFLLFSIGSERNGSHRVGTGNSYRTQLIRLLNVAALLLLLFFVLLLLVPIANSYPRVFWQISMNVLLSHKSINYLFSDTKKNFINISTTYDSYFRCGIFGKLDETQDTERTCKQNKTKQEKRREETREKLLLLIDLRPLWHADSCTWVAAGN